MGNIFEEYAIIESEIASLELKKAQLRPHILKKMIDDGMKSIDAGVGKFTVVPTKKWSYPEEVTIVVEELTDKIKEIKGKAVSTKVATCEVTPSLRFSPIKL